MQAGLRNYELTLVGLMLKNITSIKVQSCTALDCPPWNVLQYTGHVTSSNPDYRVYILSMVLVIKTKVTNDAFSFVN